MPEEKAIVLSDQPAGNFISFKHAHTLLGHKWPGSTENALKNGKIRFHEMSPKNGKARLIYRPDVEAMIRAKEKKEAENVDS